MSLCCHCWPTPRGPQIPSEVGALGKTVFFHLKLLSCPMWNSLNSLLPIFVMAQTIQNAETRAVHANYVGKQNCIMMSPGMIKGLRAQ